MNSEKIQAEINKIISDYQKQIRYARQHQPAKWQIAELTALGIIDLMPAKFGHGDASEVLKAAKQSDTAVFNAYGEGEDIGASTLYTLLNEVEEIVAEEIAIENEADLPLEYFVALDGLIPTGDWKNTDTHSLVNYKHAAAIVAKTITETEPAKRKMLRIVVWQQNFNVVEKNAYATSATIFEDFVTPENMYIKTAIDNALAS